MGVEISGSFDGLSRVAQKLHDDLLSSASDEFSNEGKYLVSHARKSGNYDDVTGRLRSSISSDVYRFVSEVTLDFGTSVEYARHVENMGYNVVSMSAIRHQKRQIDILNRIIGRVLGSENKY